MEKGPLLLELLIWQFGTLFQKLKKSLYIKFLLKDMVTANQIEKFLFMPLEDIIGLIKV